ncbi:hypothetical protein BCR39DRAFT_60626 [Naematelia encephala]|uniref:Thioesterase domain-containing protein n=1 Tax=Naematelia encephala TaxID=71784 RepID=A0A1Y2BBM1_9TREE|nr:hypothetical protein BCR39DRAFT_60626 [Naematelia encephala]
MRPPTEEDQALWSSMLRFIPLDYALLPYLSKSGDSSLSSTSPSSVSSTSTSTSLGKTSSSCSSETSTNTKGHLVLLALDDIPPLNPNGVGRKGCEGWRMRFGVDVLPEWDNSSGVMHGAVASFLVDTCTSAALISLQTDNFWSPPMVGGVSLSLDVQYFHPALVGTSLIIDVEVNRLNTTLANLTCHIREEATGKVLAMGTHIKAWRPGPQRKNGKL